MSPDERAAAVAAAVSSCSDATLDQIGILGSLAGAALDVVELTRTFDEHETLGPLLAEIAGYDQERLTVTLVAAVTIVHQQRHGRLR